MLTIDVVKNVAILLNRQNVINFLQNQGENFGDAEEQTNQILSAVNLVVSELASSYIPMVKRESVRVEGNKIAIANLSERAIEIVDVTDQNSHPLKYFTRGFYIEVDAETAVVEYKYLPSNYGINENIEFIDARVTPRIIAYGACAETCLMERSFNESVTWRKRYTDEICKLVPPKSKTIKKRRWY